MFWHFKYIHSIHRWTWEPGFCSHYIFSVFIWYAQWEGAQRLENFDKEKKKHSAWWKSNKIFNFTLLQNRSNWFFSLLWFDVFFNCFNQVNELILMSTFLFRFRQLLSPNIQQKHYLSNGYAMDGGRHVSIYITRNGIDSQLIS